MKKCYNVILLTMVCAFILPAIEVSAQEVTISAQLRPRFEYRHGYKTLSPSDTDPAIFTSQRTRFKGLFKSNMFNAGFSIQNIRVWGDVSQLNVSDVNGTAIYEAWGEIIASKAFSIKIGRQELKYDDQRIFGSVDWAQQGRSHDAVVFLIRPKSGCKLDIGIAYNAASASLFKTDYNVKNYKTMQYIHWHQDFNDFGVSVLFLNNGMTYQHEVDSVFEEKIAYNQTLGTRLTYKIKKFKVDGAFYYQFGKLKKDYDLNAIYFSANLSYAFTGLFTAGLGAEYLSGNSQVEDNSKTSKAFTPWYGTNHKFNGFMDYFFVGNHVNSVGLVDIYLPLKFKHKKFTGVIIPHYFQSAAPIHDWESMDPDATMSSYLGTEVDLVVSFAIVQGLSVVAGYSQMFATTSMEALKDVHGGSSRTNNWGWVMVNFSPTLFKSK